MLESGIAKLVAADAGVQTLIGANPCRFYPVLVPEDPVYPCASYQVISETPNYTLDGDRGINQIRLQVDSWSGGTESASYAAAKAVQVAIRDVLEGYSGQLPDGTRVAGIFVSNASDFYEQDGRCYRTFTDYMILFYPA